MCQVLLTREGTENVIWKSSRLIYALNGARIKPKKCPGKVVEAYGLQNAVFLFQQTLSRWSSRMSTVIPGRNWVKLMDRLTIIYSVSLWTSPDVALLTAEQGTQAAQGLTLPTPTGRPRRDTLPKRLFFPIWLVWVRTDLYLRRYTQDVEAGITSYPPSQIAHNEHQLSLSWVPNNSS